MLNKKTKGVLSIIITLVMSCVFAVSASATSYQYDIYSSGQYRVTQVDSPINDVCIVRLNTRPSTSNSLVTVHVKAQDNPGAIDVYSYNFPSQVSVPDCSFSMYANDTYYIYVSSANASSTNHVQGYLSVTKITA